MPNTFHTNASGNVNRGGNGYKKRSRRGKNRVGEFNEADGHYYAKAVSREGTNVLNVELHDGRSISIIIPGRYIKKVWINAGDFICCDESEMLWKVTASTELAIAKYKFKQNNIDPDDIFSAVKEADVGEKHVTLIKKLKSDSEKPDPKKSDSSKEDDYSDSSDDEWRRVAYSHKVADDI
jgi:translation initiation factor IF-1